MSWKVIDNVLTNTEFPEIADYYVIPPYPEGVWQIHNHSKLLSVNMPDDLKSYMIPPYPEGIWYIDDDNDIIAAFMPNKELLGAGCNGNIETISLPSSLRIIGDNAFTKSLLKNVTIPKDCEYNVSAFPKDCTIYKK